TSPVPTPPVPTPPVLTPPVLTPPVLTPPVLTPLISATLVYDKAADCDALRNRLVMERGVDFIVGNKKRRFACVTLRLRR
ncbi:MAG: hypothetical protein AAF663_10005, partial [Planctomycetota bacterium]